MKVSKIMNAIIWLLIGLMFGFGAYALADDGNTAEEIYVSIYESERTEDGVLVSYYSYDLPKDMETSGDFLYSVLNDDSIQIVGYVGAGGDIVIPSEINGLPVVAVAPRAFNWLRIIKSVYIPGSVKEIGFSAFANCYDIQSIVMEEGVLYLGETSFLDCKAMETFNLPDSIQHIGSGFLSGSYHLEKILMNDNPRYKLVDGVLFDTLEHRLIWYPCPKTDEKYSVPEGTVILDRYCMRESKLKRLHIPESVEIIAHSAFSASMSLEEVNIPSRVTELEQVLYSCQSLQKIDVADDNPVFYSEDGVLFSREPQTLEVYPSGRGQGEYAIPEGTVEIGRSAFSYSKFSRITIPNSVRVVGWNAFIYCKELQSLNLPDGVEVIETGAFHGCEKLTSLFIPKSVKEIGMNPIQYDIRLSSIRIDQGNPCFEVVNGCIIDKINSTLIAYSLAEGAKKIVVPDGIKVIGDSAFSNNTSLHEVVLPDGVDSILATSFLNCFNLSRISVPESVELISPIAFMDSLSPTGYTQATFVVKQGSVADQYCQTYQLKVEYTN